LAIRPRQGQKPVIEGEQTREKKGEGRHTMFKDGGGEKPPPGGAGVVV